ncbi:MAG: hypothetical protein RBS57_16015 [Desulforhabdus sp.]|jgi:G:T-mismatch repair DNA endonuclease (very short patch repair protein)|nr:hypothetical protein [Desulforhabdus sp.]
MFNNYSGVMAGGDPNTQRIWLSKFERIIIRDIESQEELRKRGYKEAQVY